jgi:hypothetical protein
MAGPWDRNPLVRGIAGHRQPHIQSVDSQMHCCLAITSLEKKPCWSFPTPVYWGPMSRSQAGLDNTGQIMY